MKSQKEQDKNRFKDYTNKMKLYLIMQALFLLLFITDVVIIFFNDWLISVLITGLIIFLLGMYVFNNKFKDENSKLQYELRLEKAKQKRKVE